MFGDCFVNKDSGSPHKSFQTQKKNKKTRNLHVKKHFDLAVRNSNLPTRNLNVPNDAYLHLCLNNPRHDILNKRNY